MGIYLTQPEPHSFKANASKSYWGEAVLTTTYLINRIPSRVLDNKSPVEVLKSLYPHFRTSNGLTPRVLGALHLFMSTTNIETS